MQLLRAGLVFTLLSGALASGHGALNAFKRHEKVRERMMEKHAKNILPRQSIAPRGEPQYLTYKTEKFAVNGTGLPEVPFDIGESYSGYGYQQIEFVTSTYSSSGCFPFPMIPTRPKNFSSGSSRAPTLKPVMKSLCGSTVALVVPRCQVC